MCHLFAFSASTARTLEPFAPLLAPFSEIDSPDGWGLAAAVGGTTTLVREPVRFATALSIGGGAVARALRAPATTLLFHLREKSVGKRSVENCHPFRRRFLGRTYLFMHNGTVPAIRKEALRTLEPAGQTDSEHAFLRLLETMPPVPPESLGGWLKEQGDRLRALGKFNCVISEGDTLWAYTDNAIHWAERQESSERLSFASSRIAASPVASSSIRRGRAPAPAGSPPRRARSGEVRTLLVASCPFTERDRWRQLAPGTLLIARAGRLVQILA